MLRETVHREPEAVGEVLGRVLGELGARSSDKRGEIFLIWKELVGEALAKHAVPAQVRKKTLVVDVDSPAWHYELDRKHKTEILTRIRTRLGEESIEDIQFRIGVIDPGEEASET